MFLITGNPEVFDDLEDTLRITCRTVDKPEICKDLVAPYNFKIMSFNIRSLNRNLTKLLPTIHRLGVELDVLVFSECWIQEHSHVPLLPGYNVFHTKNVVNKCGGVAIYVNSRWSSSAQEPSFKDANCLVVNVENCLKIVGVYRSPAFKELERFNDSLENVLNNTKEQATVVVTGDININLLAEPPSRENAVYQCLMAGHGFLPAVTEPTRGITCLDHAFIKTKGECLGLICKSSVTDHDIILVGLTTKMNNTRNKNRIITKTNYHEIARELKQIDWQPILDKDDVNEAVLTLNQIMTDCIHKHTVKRKISRSKYNLKPWITPGLIRCMRHRDHLHLQLKKNPQNDTLKTTYSRYKNFCNNLLHKLKTEHDNAKLAEHDGNPKELWKAIRNVCDIPSSKNDSHDLLANAVNPLEALNSCNQHFATAGERLASNILDKLQTSHEILNQQHSFASRTQSSLYLAPTDEREIDSIILNFKTHSAPGQDAITPLIIKYAKDALVKPLTHICNLSMSSGRFPECWKTAVVVPIHKSGDKTCPDNYRPISLLSIVSKILEKLVNKRLVDFLQKYNLLNDRQFGFRRGKSTEDAVQLLTETVAIHLDRKKRCIGVFIDLAKAFDCVSTPILLKKLESFGIRGNALSWFDSYLSNRQQRVRVGDWMSSEMLIPFGVPQGSILAPTLFTLYMDDIFNLEIPDCELVCYADDTAAIFHGKDWETVTEVAERGMAVLSEWLDVNLLSLNIKKSNFIAFHISKATNTVLTKLKLHNNCVSFSSLNKIETKCSCSSIERVKATRYLGVMLDENLSFSAHTTFTSSKVRKLLYIMKIIRASAKKEVKLLVYKTLCQSIIQYCVGVWGGAAKSHMDEVERAQRAVLKVMLGKSRRYPTNKLYEEAAVMTVRQLFVLRTIAKCHHLSSNNKQGRQNRSRDVLCPRVNTTFATRLPKYVHIFTYNSVCKLIDIHQNTFAECRHKVSKWLLSLTGEQTEKLVKYCETKRSAIFAPSSQQA